MELVHENMTISLKKFILASLAVIAAGCQIESIPVTPAVEDAVEYSAVSESYDSMTKTSMAGLEVVWSENDEVAVFQGNNRADKFGVTAESVGDTQAKLSLVQDVTDGDQIAANIAYYPYTSDLMLVENRESIESGNEILMVPDGSYSLLGVVLPTTQFYAEDSFGNGVFPMVAVTDGLEDKSFKMKNILGAIKFQITGDKEVKSVTISTRPTLVDNAYKYNSIAGTAQSVKFSPVSDPVVYMNADEPSATSVILDCGEGVALDPSVPTDFIISLVPTVFESGFIVTVVDTDGLSYQITATARNEVQRSKVLVMPEIDLDDMTPVLEVTAEPDFTDADIELEVLVEDAFGFYGIFAPKKVWEIYETAFVDPSLVQGLFDGRFEGDGLPCNYYFDTTYEGKLSHFGLDPDLADDEYCNAVYPNSSYYLIIVPEVDGKEEYTLNDFILYEVETLSLETGANIKLPNYTVAEDYFSTDVHFSSSKDISMVMYKVFDAEDELPTSENYLDFIRETVDYSPTNGFTITVANKPGVLPGASYKVGVVLADSKNRTSFYIIDVNTKAIPYDENLSVEISEPVYTKQGNKVSATVTCPDGASKLYYLINHQMNIGEYTAAEYIAGALEGNSEMKVIELTGNTDSVEVSGTAVDNMRRDVTQYVHAFVLMDSGKVSHIMTSNGVLAPKLF